MKSFVQSIAIWILRKTGCSAIIGCKIRGYVEMKNNVQFFYDNDFKNCIFYYKDKQLTGFA